MKRWAWVALLGAVILGTAGCGDSDAPMNPDELTPLTEEQKAAIKAEDAAVEAEEGESYVEP